MHSGENCIDIRGGPDFGPYSSQPFIQNLIRLRMSDVRILLCGNIFVF